MRSCVIFIILGILFVSAEVAFAENDRRSNDELNQEARLLAPALVGIDALFAMDCSFGYKVKVFELYEGMYKTENGQITSPGLEEVGMAEADRLTLGWLVFEEARKSAIQKVRSESATELEFRNYTNSRKLISFEYNEGSSSEMNSLKFNDLIKTCDAFYQDLVAGVGLDFGSVGYPNNLYGEASK